MRGIRTREFEFSLGFGQSNVPEDTPNLTTDSLLAIILKVLDMEGAYVINNNR